MVCICMYSVQAIPVVPVYVYIYIHMCMVDITVPETNMTVDKKTLEGVSPKKKSAVHYHARFLE